MLGPAGDMDLRASRHTVPRRSGAMANAVRLAEQRHLGAVGERPALRQAFQAGGDPAGLRFGETQGRGAGHAQRRRQHDAASAGSTRSEARRARGLRTKVTGRVSPA